MGMPRYCTMDDGANELSTNLKGVAEHTDHQAMGPVAVSYTHLTLPTKA